jgi:PII-like signaling protein
MLTKGPAKKVTIYVNEDTMHHHVPLYESILNFLMHHGVSGATATRAMAGFGAHHVVHTTKIEVLSYSLPICVEFIETTERVEELLPTLYDMVTDGLIEVHDTTVVKIAMKEKRPEPARAHERRQGPAKLMRIFVGEADRWKGEPLYDAIVKKLRMLNISGATVYQGILGYGAKGHTHKQHFFHISKDLPIMIAVVDSAEKLAAAAVEIERMIEDGLIVTSDVELIRLVHSHTLEEASDVRSESR